MREYVPIQFVRNIHRGHWFDQGPMRFFDSRVSHEALTRDERYYYFVSSERFHDYAHGIHKPRQYSIRCWDRELDTIDTIGEFQQYASSKAAWAAIKRLLKAQEG